MATEILLDQRKIGRDLTPSMFTDLGFPDCTFDYNDQGQFRVTFAETLTPQQIRQIKIRIRTDDANDEDLATKAIAAISQLQTYLATPTASTAADRLAAVEAQTAQNCRYLIGIIRYTISKGLE